MAAAWRWGWAVSAAIAALGALGGLALAGGAGAPPNPVRAATSGGSSERLTTVPIARRAQDERRVAISLRPHRLPTLQRGDRLRVSAEVQVTTTCVDSSERCIGRPYSFSPHVGAQLVLSRGEGAVGGRRADPISSRQELTCSQRRPNRNHHCVLVFRHGAKEVRSLANLPCPPHECFVNLVVDAHHPNARPGNVLVIGADRPDGSIVRGKGRVNAIDIRAGPRPRPHPQATHLRVNRRIPVGSERSGGQLVVYSQKLPHLRAGDVVTAEARQTTAIGHLPYNVFVSTEIVLAEHRHKAHPGRFARSVTDIGPSMDDANGFNCTHGPSAYRTPCVSRKVGVARIRRDAVDAQGRAVPLYVNLVSRTIPKLADARRGDSVRIRRNGYLRVVRYPALR